MHPHCSPSEHLSRRAFLKAGLVAGGAVLPNWGGLFNSQTIAAETQKTHKHCIFLFMNGGASQIDTFDMKPGRPTGGPFRPIASNVTGLQVCEYLPRIAKVADKLAVIRSMHTSEPDHPGGIYLMHTGFRPAVNVSHPELGAVCAKYLGKEESDLPSFVRMGPTGNGGGGYLGPKYQPFSLGRDIRLPYFTEPYASPESNTRRGDLLKFVEEEFGKDHKAEPFDAHRLAKEQSWRLNKAKSTFDVTKEWEKDRDRYGNTDFGKGCRLALKLIEAGVPFVEVGQDNYDSHADNFAWHKADLQMLDPAWSALIGDLNDRGLLKNTLIVWMGEVGRTPQINNRAGRDHFVRGWTVVLAGGGVKGGSVYGATDIDGKDVKENPVTEGDLFATIYTALGINPRAKHYVGTRPIWATPENSKVVREVLA